MSFFTATCRADTPELVNRRLASGVLLSILLHALLLSLQFGVPGLGLPSPFKPAPISMTIAPAEPAPPAVAALAMEQLPPLLPPPAPAGMQVIAPVPRSAPAVPKAAKPKPAKPRRKSRPLPPRALVETPTAVIAQDRNLSDSFVVPMAQPQEAEAPNEAQHGSDDGADTQAALLAEQAEAKAEQDRLSAAQRAEELRMLEQQRRSERELAERMQAEEQDRRQAALLQKQAEERAAQLQAEQLAAREKLQELARVQMAQAQARRQQDDQLALKQEADETAARQKAAEAALQQSEQAARQMAEQLARQHAEQLAKQQAEQLALQQAEQLARQQAEQQARQQAEQAAADGARERAAAAATPQKGAAAGNGAGGSGVTVPKNLLGSDAGNRVRELTRGLDLLSGAPPPPRARDGDDRGRRRVVAGGAEQDVPLRMYVDSFRQKVERNGGLAFAPMAPDRARIEPLVSVAIRSDGSVEEVTIVRSSGHADTDNAVRRIIRLNARYAAFPPNIATRYDVIEIRRIWSFAETLSLLEELR